MDFILWMIRGGYIKKRYLVVLSVTLYQILLWSVTVYAGEFIEGNGLVIGGYDPVAYFTEMKPLKG